MCKNTKSKNGSVVNIITFFFSTHFNSERVNIDYKHFKKYPDFFIQVIDRTIFRELLHNTFRVITEDILVERLFCCWDREIEGVIRLEPWIIGLDVFLRGSLRDKITFCFHVYDLNNDGYITKDEIFQLLK